MGVEVGIEVGTSKHTDDPTPSVICPTSQSMQSVFATLLEYFPIGQLEHTEPTEVTIPKGTPILAYRPGPQATQPVAAMLLLLMYPASQASHAVLPLPLAYWPCTQGIQKVLPKESAYIPAGQGVHFPVRAPLPIVALTLANVPASHCLHSKPPVVTPVTDPGWHVVQLEEAVTVFCFPTGQLVH